ncbi:transmembrane channel-like protein [Cylas formicarius]|uniref:transmembrane channel-like protein n=1 Tax=Cylas formicarius TaxID=197179 RepID=UPI0029586329|nr:transmembrane channel-like protein [Cylas formicarius]
MERKKLRISEQVSGSRNSPAGILRIDLGGRSRPSGEFKFNQGEPTSPQPSIDRLSVTFAEDSVKIDPKGTTSSNSSGAETMDKTPPPIQDGTQADSDQEDYSASVNAIIQRRASSRRSRRRNRRASSPLDVMPGLDNGRRRSSVFTTSSGDTAITVDDNLNNEVTQEEIFENIKLHKEVLGNVKMQPWNMRKKLKLVVQAKSYIKKHEGKLQERLAQSHSTKDMLARWNIYIIKKWQRWKRELTNFSMWFIPWELKIKEIESHFGSVVASYFIFLRWLFWVNIVIAVVIISFVTIPEIITADPQAVKDRKFVLGEERFNSTNFLTLWDFEGVFKYSPLFYGWYTNRDYNDSAILNEVDHRKHMSHGYRLPFAYFVTGLVVYAYSFFATLRKMAENSRMSKLSEKDDECIFSWKLFTAWDYMIGNAETAHNRVASIVMGFKEALLEEAEKKRESRNWKVICFRVLVNTLVAGLLSFSAFAVIVVVKRSTDPDANSTVWRRNEITVVMSLITLFFPMLFEVLGLLEQYHPRKQLRLQLARIMVLNLLNLYSLIFALFDKISDMTVLLQEFKNESTRNADADLNTSTTAINVLTTETSPDKTADCMCYDNDIFKQVLTSADLISEAAHNVSLYIMPKLEDLRNNVSEVFLSTYANMTESVSPNSTELNFLDIKDTFVDYLTYLLSQFASNTSTELNSTGWYNHSTDQYFKTTISSLLNATYPSDDERFDTQLSTLYDDVSSTVTSFVTSTSTSEMEGFTTALVPRDAICIELCRNSLKPQTTAISTRHVSDYIRNAKLRSLCWETMFGQELIKLTVMDLIMTGLSTLAMDFFRGIFVRVMNRCWCWDLEKKFPQYGDFKVAENILHLVNNQGMVWMGMFFSPGLVVLNVVKLYIMMYLRAWAVLTCNVPHEIIFRASRSNNFYYALLLMMLFLCVLPVGYAIVWIEPSWHCGPFSHYERIFHIFTKTIRATVPPSMHKALDYIASPGIVIPLLLLLVLIIYYLVSLTGALREANNDLKVQLRRERTEERRKMFQLVDRRRRAGSGGSNDDGATPFSKWKKLLGNLPSGRSYEDTTKQESEEMAPSQNNEEKVENKSRVFFSKLIKKALGKSSTSEEEQDGTDTEQHDSLPYDTNKPVSHKPVGRSVSNSSFELQALVNRAWSLKKNERNPEKSVISEETPDREDREVHQECCRQDSASSVIPVITISKTESTEAILNEEVTVKTKSKGTEPKIKCVLKKQSTEIDEDIICHFGEDLEKMRRDDLLFETAVREKFEDDLKRDVGELRREDILSDNEENDVKDEVSVITVVNVAR